MGSIVAKNRESEGKTSLPTALTYLVVADDRRHAFALRRELELLQTRVLLLHYHRVPVLGRQRHLDAHAVPLPAQQPHTAVPSCPHLRNRAGRVRPLETATGTRPSKLRQST